MVYIRDGVVLAITITSALYIELMAMEAYGPRYCPHVWLAVGCIVVSSLVEHVTRRLGYTS